MFKDLGEMVRSLREKNGYSLNKLAKKLGVSSGYLSNLETGKSDKVSLIFMDKLQYELKVLPFDLQFDLYTDARLERLLIELKDISEVNPDWGDYILDSLAFQISWYRSKKMES